VVQEAIQGASPPAERISDIICDINGERYRGEEWGFVCLRLPQYFNDPTAYRSPADCWGDMGAASGPLFMMLACQAAERGYAKSARCLVWAGSENGLRGAVVLGWENIAQRDGNRISHG
jgi:3-oxoacyl-[acyl-carrier-protein] synthase-1